MKNIVAHKSAEDAFCIVIKLVIYAKEMGEKTKQITSVIVKPNKKYFLVCGNPERLNHFFIVRIISPNFVGICDIIMLKYNYKYSRIVVIWNILKIFLSIV